MKSRFQLLLTGTLLLAAVGAAGCSSSTSSGDGTKTASKPVAEPASSPQPSAEGETPQADAAAGTQAQAEAEEESNLEAARIIQNPGKVQNRGGYIRLLVNKEPVTNFDIQRRAKFMELRRVRGNRKKLAEKEMIEQVIKQQEARRLNMLAGDTEVNGAFATFASRNRSSPSQMAGQLNQFGVGADHFKEFIRTQMSWQRVIQGRFQAETTRMSEREAVTMLRKSGSAKPEVTEYNLQQIIFVVPEAKRNKTFLAARKQEATAFRQRFTGCEASIALAKALRDVAVVEQNRILEPQLPAGWADEIPTIEVNQTSRPKETDRGIEVMAVCTKRQVDDDRAAQITTQSSEFDSFNDKGGELSENYLKELVSRSTIVYR